MVDIEVSFASPAGVERNVEPGRILSGVSFEFLESGGMGQATIPLLAQWEGTDYGLAPVAIGDTVTIRVEGSIRYVGRVTETDRQLGIPEMLNLTAFGEMERMNSVRLVRQVIVKPGGSDLTAFATDILAEYNARLGTSYATDFDTTGITLETLSLENATARQAMDALFERAQGAVVWGWEADATTGALTCYLRPRTETIGWQRNVGQDVRLLGERSPLSDVYNALSPLRGAEGKASFPNALGAICRTDDGKPNTSFEYPVAAGSVGNLILNPGLVSEFLNPLGAVEWTATGGATQNGLAGRYDGYGMELTGGAKIVQQVNSVNVRGLKVYAGHVYRLAVDARRGSGDGRLVKFRLQWKNAGGSNVGSVNVLNVYPDSALWQTYPLGSGGLPGGYDLTAPSGATGYLIELEGDTGGGSGSGTTYVDNISLVDVSATQQPGWEAFASGTAVINSLNWSYDGDAYHGKLCIDIDVTASDSDGNDVTIRPLNNAQFRIDPLQSMVVGYRFKSYPGQTSTPKMRLRLAPNKADGSNGSVPLVWDGGASLDTLGRVNALTADVAAVGSETTAWTFCGSTVQAASDWYQSEFNIQLRGSGRVLIDAAIAMDAACPLYYPGDTVEHWARVDDTDIAPKLSAAAAASITTYGLRETTATFDGVTTWNDRTAQVVADWFEKNAVLTPPRRLELDSESAFITPATGQQVRISGVDEDLSDQWPARAVYRWQGKLPASVELGDPQPTLTREILRAKSGNMAVGGGGASGGGGPLSVTETYLSTITVSPSDSTLHDDYRPADGPHVLSAERTAWQGTTDLVDANSASWNDAATWVTTNGGNVTSWNDAATWVTDNGAYVLSNASIVDGGYVSWSNNVTEVQNARVVSAVPGDLTEDGVTSPNATYASLVEALDAVTGYFSALFKARTASPYLDGAQTYQVLTALGSGNVEFRHGARWGTGAILNGGTLTENAWHFVTGGTTAGNNAMSFPSVSGNGLPFIGAVLPAGYTLTVGGTAFIGPIFVQFQYNGSTWNTVSVYTAADRPRMATLTDAATIAVDATLGGVFSVTLGGNRTLGNPTNARDGQRLTFRIRQDGTGSRVLTLDTKYRLGTDIASVTLTTTPNKTDYLTVQYSATDDKFDVIDFKRGY